MGDRDGRTGKSGTLCVAACKVAPGDNLTCYAILYQIYSVAFSNTERRPSTANRQATRQAIRLCWELYKAVTVALGSSCPNNTLLV